MDEKIREPKNNKSLVFVCVIKKKTQRFNVISKNIIAVRIATETIRFLNFASLMLAEI